MARNPNTSAVFDALAHQAGDDLNTLTRYAAVDKRTWQMLRKMTSGKVEFSTQEQLESFIESAPIFTCMTEVTVTAALRWAQAHFMHLPRERPFEAGGWWATYRPPLIEKLLASKFPGARSVTLVLKVPAQTPTGKEIPVALMNLGKYEEVAVSVVHDDSVPHPEVLTGKDLIALQIDDSDSFQWQFHGEGGAWQPEDVDEEKLHLCNDVWICWSNYWSGDEQPLTGAPPKTVYEVWYPMRAFIRLMHQAQDIRRMTLDNVRLDTDIHTSDSQYRDETIHLECVTLSSTAGLVIGERHDNVTVDEVRGRGAVAFQMYIDMPCLKSIETAWPHEIGYDTWGHPQVLPNATKLTLHVRDRLDLVKEVFYGNGLGSNVLDPLLDPFEYTLREIGGTNQDEVKFDAKHLTLVLEDIAEDRAVNLLALVRELCAKTGCVLDLQES